MHTEVRSMRSVGCHAATFRHAPRRAPAPPPQLFHAFSSLNPSLLTSLSPIPPHPPPRCSLTDEPMDEPVKRLPREAQASGLPPDAFVMLRHGALLATAGGATLNAPARLS